MSWEYHIHLRGQKDVVLNKKQWEAIRQKDASGRYFVPREDQIVQGSNGEEFNLRKYDGCTPVFVDDKRPQFYQETERFQLTDRERAKAHEVMVEAKYRWILRTGKGYNKLNEEEKRTLTQVKEKLQIEAFTNGPDHEAERAIRREFNREFWDVLFETDEARETTFAKWRLGRNGYSDPRDYNRWDFVSNGQEKLNEVHATATKHDAGDIPELSANETRDPGLFAA